MNEVKNPMTVFSNIFYPFQQTAHASGMSAVYSSCRQGGIFGVKQWRINIKIEEKLTKNGGKIDFPSTIEGTIPLSPLQIPCTLHVGLSLV